MSLQRVNASKWSHHAPWMRLRERYYLRSTRSALRRYRQDTGLHAGYEDSSYELLDQQKTLKLRLNGVHPPQQCSEPVAGLRRR